MQRNYISGIRLKTPVDKASYLNNLPKVQYLSPLNALEFASVVTFLVGENGMGKSTLLETIAAAKTRR
ncbi:hypothetical protein SDC9_139468 [bioreactor metagenome]|uniref:Rad50/SbcC-type AAA domain-containing protein n=1 Tax=bioreactor metagenome TaxID=1076179 RepID=A0A645DUS1_9ZZZZ